MKTPKRKLSATENRVLNMVRAGDADIAITVSLVLDMEGRHVSDSYVSTCLATLTRMGYLTRKKATNHGGHWFYEYRPVEEMPPCE